MKSNNVTKIIHWLHNSACLSVVTETSIPTALPCGGGPVVQESGDSKHGLEYV